MAKNQKKERKTCVIYTRVSTAIQVDGYSLKAQEDVLRAEAAHRGYEVLKVYPDEGKSGKNIKGRPKFIEMLDDIQNPEMETPDYVYVFKLSRFGRNAADTLSSLQFLEDHGAFPGCWIQILTGGILWDAVAGKVFWAMFLQPVGETDALKGSIESPLGYILIR